MKGIPLLGAWLSSNGRSSLDTPLEFFYHNPMKRILPLIIGLAVLIAALVTLNKGISLNAPSDADPDQSQSSSTQSTTPQSPTQTAPTAPAPGSRAPIPPGMLSAPAKTAANDAAGRVPEETVVGDPKTAKYHVTIGWKYDGTNQGDTSGIRDVVRQATAIAQQSQGKISVQAVDVNVPDEDRSAAAKGIETTGVSVNGKSTFDVGGKTLALSDNPGEGATTPANVGQALSSLK